MNNNKLISDNELNFFGKTENLSQKAEVLLNQQKEKWDLVKTNYEALNKVKSKKFYFNKIYIQTQFNPSRITSTSAKVDKKSIAERACFLCEENLPGVQKGISYKDRYIILINPYPIFKQHLTIPHYDHIPQNIENAFGDLLDLSFDLKDNFFVFYNGPKCGASAPDHLHFQAGVKNSTPLEKYYAQLIDNGKKIIDEEKIKVISVKEDFINLIYIQSDYRENIKNVFNKIFLELKKNQNTEEEPLLNTISFYKNKSWHLFIIPRKKHRPEQFFAEDDSKLLISPASVDMAGLLITPREEDFNKLKKADIESIYGQVFANNDQINKLISIF